MKYTEEEVRSATKAWHKQDTNNISHHILKLGLAISFDMGWQKRSTGKLYDSLSGHAYKIGCRTGEIIGLRVKCKKCTICRKANKRGIPAPEHKCTINWTGASGAMEAGVALEMVKKLCEDYDGRLYTEYIVSDDDSSMRSHLRHIDDGGKLPPNVPQPTFLADPSHRIKTMCSPIYKMITNTKDPSKCKKIDFLRVKKYISCYIYQNKSSPLEDLVKRARAPIEHLFNVHKWCDPEWCWSKSLDDQQEKMMNHVRQYHESNMPNCIPCTGAP